MTNLPTPKHPIRSVVRPLAAALLLAAAAGCSRAPTADPAKARVVLDKLLQAEMEHRDSHGNFWRDRQPTVNRVESMKFIGVDVGEAAGFDVMIEPASDGMDTTLRVSARPKAGASGPTITCSQKAGDPQPSCAES